MKGVGKVVGALILVLLGIPSLVLVIWATGVTRGVFGESYFTDVGERVVARAPGFVDESFEAARQPGATTDPEARAWLDAVAQVQPSPAEMMGQIGITSWLQEDVVAMLREIDQVLRGARAPTEVTLDMRPLKRALTSAEARDYFTRVIAHLPDCDPAKVAEWRQRDWTRDQDEPVPACNPGPEATSRALDLMAVHVAEIPDEVRIFDEEALPPSMDAVRTVKVAMWLVFLVPVFLIAIGAALGGEGGRGFFGWSGWTVLAGGLVALASSAFARFMPALMIRWVPAEWTPKSDQWFWTTGAGEAFAGRAEETMEIVVNPLLTPVVVIAAATVAVGVVLLVIAAVTPRRAERTGV